MAPLLGRQSVIDLLGHIAMGFVALGSLLLGTKDKRAAGWRLRMIGDGMWVGLGFALGLSSIVIWESVFVVVDIVGLRKC